MQLRVALKKSDNFWDFRNAVTRYTHCGQCNISRDMVVFRAAQENGAHANGVSILTGITKSRFSRICSSVIAYPNGTKFTVELASMKGRPHFRF